MIHRTWHTLININTWNFNSLLRACLIFHIRFCELQSIGNNTMKKCYRYCAGPAYYRMCSTDVYCSKQTGSSSTKRETITHHFLFLELRRNCRCSQNFRRRRKNVVKTETQQTFVNDFRFGFITLGIYTPLEARVAVIGTAELPIDMGNSSATSVITLSGFLQLFLIVISLSLRVK